MTGLDMQMFGGAGGPAGAGAGGPPGGPGSAAFAEAEAEMAAERAAAEAAEKKRKEEEEAKKKAEEAASKPKGWAEAEAKKAEGNTYYKKKDFPKAIELYSAAIELCPEEIIYYSNLAAVYIEMKEYDKAIEECDKAIAKTKEGPYDFAKAGKVLCRKASALQKKGDLDASIETYKAALLENNDYWAKDSLKKVQKLKEEQDKLAYINPALSDEHKDKGNGFFKNGDFPSALKEFDEAIRRNPKNIAVFANRSATYTKLMDPARALADAEQCIKIDDKFTKGWIRKAQSHQLQKEYHKAMEAWQKAMALEPDNAEVKAGFTKTMNAINSSSHASSGDDQERMAHAMADPEIQNIMRDPSVMQVLRDMQENPMAGQAALKDPVIMAKI